MCWNCFNGQYNIIKKGMWRLSQKYKDTYTNEKTKGPLAKSRSNTKCQTRRNMISLGHLAQLKQFK